MTERGPGLVYVPNEQEDPKVLTDKHLSGVARVEQTDLLSFGNVEEEPIPRLVYGTASGVATRRVKAVGTGLFWTYRGHVHALDQ